MDVVVLGLGYVGLPLAVHAAESGYKVFGFDIDQHKIKDLQKNHTSSTEITSNQLKILQASGKLIISNELPPVVSSAIFVIAVPTPLDSNHNPQLDMLKSACKYVASVVNEGSLVINESTSYIGTLRNLIKPLIDKNSGKSQVKYAVAPERIDPGNKIWNLANTPRIVAGLDHESTSAAVNFYSKFCQKVHQVSSPEVAEASKLLENTFRQINIAMINEFSTISEKLGFSANEVVGASSTKPFGFMPFYPSIGVGGHCIPVDPTYLSYSAKNTGLEFKFINLANEINRSMPKEVTDRIKLKFSGDLSNKKIQIAGIAYKPNTSDLRESPALELIGLLRNQGASVSWFDPLVKVHNGELSQPNLTNCDLGLIVTPHDQMDFSIWKISGTLVFDLSSNTKNYGWAKFL